MKALPLVALPLLLLLAACSDVAMFSPSTGEGATVEVRSLNQGGTVQPGQPVQFVIHREGGGGSSLQLEISLSDASGKGVWSRTLSDPVVNEELELQLPQLDTGLYHLHFRVSGLGGGDGDKDLEFFYVQGTYAIAGLTSFPPSTAPGAEIVVTADLRYPEGSDPYVRWTQAGEVLARGRVSQGLNRITWSAPKQEGVYSLQVELFPVVPTGQADFPFSSAIAMAARLFVSSQPAVALDALLPEKSYFSLFHLDGDLRDRGAGPSLAVGDVGGAQDTGAAAALPEAEAFGGAAYAAKSAVPGYLVGQGAGIRYARTIFPSAGGRLAPCTLTMLVDPRETPRSVVLLRAETAGGSGWLRLGFDGAGQLAAVLVTLEGPVELPSGVGPLQQGTPHRIDLSLIPADKSLTALWFLDGVQKASLVRGVTPPAAAPGGRTVLSGEDGFAGVMAELGVYYLDDQARPAVDGSIYRAAMQRRFGKTLLLAEGFEGLYLPSGFRLEGGGASPREGTLQVPPGAVLHTPLFEATLPVTVLEVTTAGPLPSDSRVVLRWEGETEGFAELRGDGTLLDPAAPGGSVAAASLPNPLELRLTADSLTVQAAQPATLPVRAPAGDSRWLSLEVAGPGKGPALGIDSLLFYGSR